MRRLALLLSVAGAMSAGLGCKHIGGKCDCQANPADAVLPSPTTPYHAMPVTSVPAAGTVAPAPIPMAPAAPVTPMPR